VEKVAAEREEYWNHYRPCPRRLPLRCLDNRGAYPKVIYPPPAPRPVSEFVFAFVLRGRCYGGLGNEAVVEDSKLARGYILATWR